MTRTQLPILLLCALPLPNLAGCASQLDTQIAQAGPGRSPTYLADLDRIERPLPPSGFYSVPASLLSRALGATEDSSTSAVASFVSLCIPLAMKSLVRGADLDVNLLDPLQTGVAPHHGRAYAPSRAFCVPKPPGVADDDAGAMKRALANALPALTGDMTYLPREPSWCGGGRLLHSEPPANDITVSFLNRIGGVEKTPAQCWVSARTAAFATVLAALPPSLAKAGLPITRDPLVHDGSLLHQAAFVTTAGGVTRTILVSGPNTSRLNGPRVEIQVLIGRFVAR